MNPRHRDYLRPRRINHSKTVTALYTGAARPCVLTHRTFAAIAQEQGGEHEAWLWLARLVEHGPRPIFVNIPRPNGESSTVAISPSGWTGERLQGHIATLAPALEAAYGDIERMEPAG